MESEQGKINSGIFELSDLNWTKARPKINCELKKTLKSASKKKKNVLSRLGIVFYVMFWDSHSLTASKTNLVQTSEIQTI